MTTIDPIAIDLLLAQGQGLFELHRAEVGDAASKLPLAVDGDIFRAMERAGILLSLGVFCMDRVVGYAVGTVTKHHFSSETLVGNALAIYVHPSFRRRGNGRTLKNRFEAAAFERGAVEVRWHAPKHAPLLALLRNAQELETTYVVKKHG